MPHITKNSPALILRRQAQFPVAKLDTCGQTANPDLLALSQEDT